ncbi:MAG: hypothetical protein EAZ88_15250 [Oscillatoriales cyanobacterium]|nr:MAG: hypothetical protein EAZ88_15250 [Oscillatoriales cyanobacterium]TAG72479.1 MAG: hypothetical protein EAZ23_14260 [Oscillatoriales cyanobacterium]
MNLYLKMLFSLIAATNEKKLTVAGEAFQIRNILMNIKYGLTAILEHIRPVAKKITELQLKALSFRPES